MRAYRMNLRARVLADPLDWQLRDDWIDDTRQRIAYLRELLRSGVALDIFLPSLWGFVDAEEPERPEALSSRAAASARLAPSCKHAVVRASVPLFDVAAQQPVFLVHLWCKRNAFHAVGHLDYDPSLEWFDLALPEDHGAWLPEQWVRVERALVDALDAIVDALPYNLSHDDGQDAPRAVVVCETLAWRVFCGVAFATWCYGARCSRHDHLFEGEDAERMFFDKAFAWLVCCRVLGGAVAPAARAGRAEPERPSGPYQRAGYGLRSFPWRVAGARRAEADERR